MIRGNLRKQLRDERPAHAAEFFEKPRLFGYFHQPQPKYQDAHQSDRDRDRLFSTFEDGLIDFLNRSVYKRENKADNG